MPFLLVLGVNAHKKKYIFWLQIVEESTRHEKNDEADDFKDTVKRKVGKDGEHPFAIEFFIIKQQYNGDTQNANGCKLRLVGGGQEAVVVQ